MKKIVSILLSASLCLGGFSGMSLGTAAAETGTSESGKARSTGSLCVSHLTVDHLTEPMGIDSETPVFSWQIADDAVRAWKQTAYRITVADSEQALSEGTYVWDSTQIASDETVDIPYDGAALAPATRYYWQVSVTGKNGENAVSDVAWFETGLMDSGWSDAKWIARSEPKSDAYFSLTDFTLDFDYAITANAASILFGGTGDGDFYMWQISAFSWHSDLRLRPHKCTSGGFAELPGAALAADKSSVGSWQHMTIQASGGTVKTYLDGVLKDTRTIAGLELGFIGFRCAGSEGFKIDNIVVKDGSGTVVLDADFDNGDAKGFEKSALQNGELVFDSSALSGSIFLRKFSGEVKAESAPMLRKAFSTAEGKAVERARLYVTAAGLYDAYINGERVTDTRLNPGMTAYDDHILYQTYDVTSLVKEGENVVGAYLGHGWFNKALRNFGTTLCLYAKLVVTYADGTSDTVVTDDSWRFFRYGPILDDDIFNGFKYDALTEKALDGWNCPGYDDSAWDDVSVIAPNKIVNNGQTPAVIAQNLPPIRNTVELPALSVSEPKEGVYVYDFGQNIAGVVRITASAPAGTTVTMRHAEILNRENMAGADDDPGMIFTGNLPRADATDTYVFRGDKGEETFEPFFVYHGFRYVEITGLDEPLPLENVTALLITSDLEQTSSFESSNALVNRLYLNSLWSARDNFMSVPTDCPQRGERFGWTGDAQIFARTGSYLMDVNAFYQKYCMDMRDTSKNNRIIADVSPASSGAGWYGSGDRKEATNGWGDAIIIIPYQMYKQYGNRAVLEENYEIMCNWMDYLVSTSTDYIRDQSWTGDWLPVNEPKSPVALTDTAFCAYSASLLAEISDILGETAKADEYRALYNSYRTAWRAKFLTGGEGGKTACGTQTSYVLGIKFGLFDEDEIPAAAENLVKNIKAQGWHLTTGFLGLSYLNPVLSDTGYSEVAYRLLEQEEYPSWLYSVTTGSTTIWESWYAFRLYEDGSSKMSAESLNHFSYGAVTEWLYRYVLGIERDDADEAGVGFKHFLLKPQFGGSFTYANGSYDSVRGTVESGWTLNKETGAFTYHAVVPANTTATLYLPVKDADTAVLESGVNASDAEGVTLVGYADGCMVYELGSGSYDFSTTVNPNGNAVTSVKVTDAQEVGASLTVGGTTYTSFPQSVILSVPEVSLSAQSDDPLYVFRHFEDAQGNRYENGVTVSGDNDLNMVFAYTGTDDGTDTEKTVTLTGGSGIGVLVNGEPHTLPYSERFAKGADVILEITELPDGYELDGIGDIVGVGNTVYLRPLCDITAEVTTKTERFREGYDIFFDFEDSIGYWRGINASVSYEPGYMRFTSTVKSDGTYDPRAYYDFTESSGTITGGAYVPAADYDAIIIGYIADEVAADSKPVMYISTEAQPNYINPVRGKSADSSILASYADGKTLREVQYSLGTWSAWTGNIKQIYLDIVDNVYGNLRVDYIRFKHRDMTLTVKKNALDSGTVYTYVPGSTVDLAALAAEQGENFLGFSAQPDSEEYVGTVVMDCDRVLYANYAQEVLPVIKWTFDTGTAEDWTVQNGYSQNTSGGALQVTYAADKSDVWVYHTGIGADASVYKYVAFDLSHNIPDGSFGSKPCEVFFRRPSDGWGQHLSVSTAQKSAALGTQTYVLDMSSCAHWNGTVDILRIDPFETAPSENGGYSFTIDNIMLCPEAVLTFDGGYEGAESTAYGVPAYVTLDLAAYPTPEREGYVFQGWTDGESGNVLDSLTLSKDATLYAVWKKQPVLEWNFDDNTMMDWTVVNGTGSVTDGVLHAEFGTSNGDLWLRRENLNIDAAAYRYAVVTLRHNLPAGSFGSKPAELFFTRTTDSPWQQHLSANTAQTAASDFVPWVIDLQSCSLWNGTVNRLRFDPFEITSTSAATYYVEVDSIRLCAAVTLTLDGGYQGAAQNAYSVPAGVPVSLDAYPIPEREGYIFVGWTDGVSDTLLETVTPNGDTTLYAAWEKDKPHTVTTVIKSESGNVLKTQLYAIPESAVVVFASYKEGRLVEVEMRSAVEPTLHYNCPEAIDKVKVIVLDSAASLRPLCAEAALSL